MAESAGLYPYPTGWFAVAFSSDLAPGEVQTVHYFGQDIVLYRTEPRQAGGRGADDGAPVVRRRPRSEPTLRVESVDEYFDRLDRRFVPAGSEGIDAVFQWQLEQSSGSIERYAIVKDGRMALHQGNHAQPTVTIAMQADDYVAMGNRELDGAMAFTTGRGKLRGSVSMAMKMRRIFPD